MCKMICRPRKEVMFSLLDWKFCIWLRPQQKWEYYISSDGFTVYRTNLSIKLSEKEFDEYFKDLSIE